MENNELNDEMVDYENIEEMAELDGEAKHKDNNIQKWFGKNKRNVQKQINNAAGKANKIAKKAGVLAKQAGNQVIQTVEDTKFNIDKNRFRPVLLEEYQDEEYQRPKMLLLLEEDEHADVPACFNAIAYTPRIVNTPVLEVIPKNQNSLGISLVPNTQGLVYYENPYIPKEYIDFQNYFKHLKIAKVVELTNIAKSLGAKHVKITIKEKEKSFIAVKGKKAKGMKFPGAKANEKLDIGADYSKSTTIEIADERYFENTQTPTRPKLVYYKNDIVIDSLIEQRLCESPITSFKNTLEFNSNLDINIKVASEIDATLEKWD